MSTPVPTTPSAPPLRVLYSFPHPLGNPGIGTTAINQVRGLSRAGQSVTVVTTSLSAPLPSDVELHETMAWRNRRLPHRAVGVARAYRYHDRVVARFVRRHAQDFDVVHAWPRACQHTFASSRTHGIVGFRESPSPHTGSSFEAAERAAASVGLTMPDGHSHRSDPQRLRDEEAEYAAADFILAPSEFVVDSYTGRGEYEDKLVRHRYGFDPDEFPPPPPRDQRRPFTAVFVGEGAPHKGLHFALEAWQRAAIGPDCRLLLVGRVDASYRAVLEPYLGPSAGVVELGFQADVGSQLRHCDALLLASVSEGSALVTYEAMASGVVPLVSDATGSPVRDGLDGLIHRVGDVDALTAHIERLHDEPDTLARMRAAGIDRRDELSWDRAGRHLADAYATGLVRARRPIPTGGC